MKVTSIRLRISFIISLNLFVKSIGREKTKILTVLKTDTCNWIEYIKAYRIIRLKELCKMTL